MISTTLRAESLGAIASAVAVAIGRFLVNPFGWKLHTTIHLAGNKHSPHITLSRRWYLEETNTPISADIVLQKDRLGRRRIRILNLVDMTKLDVRRTEYHIAAAQWVITGKDEMLKAMKA